MMNGMKIELIKQRRWAPILCIILPFMLNLLLLLSLTFRYEGFLIPNMHELELTYWQLIFKEQTILYFSELSHIVVAVLVFEAFYVELKNNGWMLVASSEYRKNGVTQGKLMVVVLNIIIYFVTDYLLLYIIGKIIRVPGEFEATLFMKSFLIQVISAIMMATFFIMLVFLLRRINFLLSLSFVIMMLNAGLYYNKGSKLLLQYPFTYISHGFRATGKETLIVVSIAIILALIFMYVSQRAVEKNSDLVM